MSTALNIKRKNIDLPVETMQKLSIMAASAGLSLKKFIENTLIAKADAVTIEVSENPSPSGDTWFDNAENTASVKRGLEDIEAGRYRVHSMDEIRKILGV